MLGVDPEKGLESSAVKERRDKYGWNTLPRARSLPLAVLFLQQFVSPLIYLLLAAALIAFVMGDRRDAFVILGVLVMNSVISTFQEGRAQRSMEALRKLTLAKAKILRDESEQEISATELLPGDLLILSAGDQIGADARLIEAASLSVNESALTGESLPIPKQPSPLPMETTMSERSNTVYSGTHVCSGRGRALVISTGMNSEFGKIAKLTTSASEPKTPLEVRIAAFGRSLAWASVVLCMITLGFGVIRGLPFQEILMVAISQLVSVVPEGLPVAMTIALAVGMQRMARKGAIVRRLGSIETLGSASVICCDKTGTLTRNEMTVKSVWLPGEGLLEVSGEGYSPDGVITHGGSPIGDATRRSLLPLTEALLLCNDAHLLPPDAHNPRSRILGDPTEAALLTLGAKVGLSTAGLRERWQRVSEMPFDSSSKIMATLDRDENSVVRISLKGAPEVITSLCARARVGGSVKPLDPALRKQTLEIAEEMSRQAFRCLAVAEWDHPVIHAQAGVEQFSAKLTLLGLVGQMDPPREEVAKALEASAEAGIRTIMLTGDHKATGLAVARRLGIAKEGEIAMEGRELETVPDKELPEVLRCTSVFARVYPAQKLKIVAALQSRGEIVAMTGDGVNDAPALARADVGVSMGISGTEVAKSAAKIVLTDDNFATLVAAIQEGRIVYRNIKKVILFLLATSIDEVIVLLLALFSGHTLPFAAVQILWINVVTESVATVNLVMEGAEGDEMKQPPVSPNAPLLDREMIRRLCVMVSSSVLVVFGFYLWRLSTEVPFELVQSETFTLMAVSQWFNVLNCRNLSRSVIDRRIFSNLWLTGGLLCGILLQYLVIYSETLNRYFHTTPIPLRDLVLIIALGSLVLVPEEIRKFFTRRKLQM
jgi:Ca2+-transporting ATPase